jgi:hypothetical protein
MQSILPLLVGFLGGGLAGNIFTYYANRPSSTIVTYTITTTTLAAPNAEAAIPNLKVQVGNELIHALYAHSIDLSSPRGPFLEQGTVAILFPKKVRIFGTTAEPPTTLSAIACKEIANGARCTLGPISSQLKKPYHIVLATDQHVAPEVEMVGNHIDLLSVENYAASDQSSWLKTANSKVAFFGVWFPLLLGSLTGLLGLLPRLAARVTRQINDPIIVGKIASEAGAPVNGAAVEVQLESPRQVTYSIVETDAYGDFIVGGRTKFGFIKGKVRITHRGFAARTVDFSSPIITETLTAERE